MEKVEIKNRKATFEFEILDLLTAGIQLTGTEIKSVRESKVNIADAFCFFKNRELFVRNLHISEYEKGGFYNHEPKRERKLLLNRKELNKWETKLKEKGFTIVPIRMFINEKGFAKLEIGLARGKKTYDKREDLKTKDSKREIDRVMKQYK